MVIYLKNSKLTKDREAVESSFKKSAKSTHLFSIIGNELVLLGLFFHTEHL